MVMDQPSPQSVGREFVRQYYTMLHEAPGFLHRFYSHDSSFLHGGVDKSGEEQLPAVGQAEIFKKITSLNFHDCHAKIRQVDSQSSINGSVVIQVVGELSNNGLPLRRFMQTFVLAPQSPKKYYVHNDIFRYQDEVFSDANELETPDESFEVDTVEDDESRIAETGVKNNLVDTSYEQEQLTGVLESVSNGNSSTMDEHMKSPGEEEEEPVDQAVVVENSLVENEAELPCAGDQMEEQAEELNGESSQDGLHENQEEEQSPAAAVVPASVEEQVEDGEKTVESDTEQANIQSVPQKPTWAAMASKNMANSASSVSSNAGSGTGMPGFATKPQATIRPEPKPENNTAVPGLPQRTPRSIRPEMNAGDNGRSGFDGTDDAGRGIQQYPDNQQVFVGNLPHYLADKELREFFEKYGPVLDMRINRKANNNLPNFGFVVFDSTETVQKVLAARPLFNGKHRVNVEEKKPREELVASRDSRPRSSGNRIPSGKFSGPSGSGAGRGDSTPAGRGGGRPGALNSSSAAGSGRGSYIRSSVSDEGKSPNQPNAR